MTTSATTVKVHRVYIKTTPQRIWDAITRPEWTERYGYTGRSEFDLRPGGAYRTTASEAMRKSGAEMGFDVPELICDGEVVEADPPRRLVYTWRMLMDPAIAEEGFTRLTWEIEETGNGICKLTVIHDVTGAPGFEALVDGKLEAEGAGGGWFWVLSDLKSLLETGDALTGAVV